jgi:membrane-bound lytic murein transglycosylase D
MYYTSLSRNNWAVIAVLFFSLIVIAFDNTNRGVKSTKGNSANEILTEADKVPVNRHARQFVNNYILENKECLYEIRQRSNSPFNTIDAIFSRYGLPIQLKYLAVIESELKTTAVSRVGAVGPWQLMPETAQLLGLTVNNAQDDRRNYYKSTKAAAIYLRDLYSEFGDWLLVLAAYNCGPAPVNRAIRQSGSRNFWALQYYLPAESRAHVKKFIAAHFYFEQQGGVTTFTKAEWKAYNSPVRVARS